MNKKKTNSPTHLGNNLKTKTISALLRPTTLFLLCSSITVTQANQNTVTSVVNKSGHSNSVNFKKTINQQIRINGKITDTQGRSLPGVLITEIETGKKTTTDVNGNFQLTVNNASSKLRITSVGFATQEKIASQNMTIILQEGNDELEEVVITGYQKIDKTTFTGSVSKIDLKNIDRSGAIDVSRMLQGAAAGVSVQNTSGTFGATPKIRIRGNSSISANQEPLYVINGVPITSPSNVSVNQLYSGDPASILSSAIAGLNAQDIEDIQILKDGAATALYGTRAANGVIVITTKKGSAGQQTINFSSALSVGVKPNINQFNLMNSNQEMSLYKEMYDRGYLSDNNWPFSTGAFTETYKNLALNNITLDQAYQELNRSSEVNTDWFDVLFRNNLIQEHSLSFSGGTEKQTYYTSGSYSTDNGQAQGFNMNRYTFDARTVLNINKRLSLDVNLNWNYRAQRTPGTYNAGRINSNVARQFEINPFLYAFQTSRAMYPYHEDGSYKYYTENLAPFNIIEELNENFNKTRVQDIRATLAPTIKIHKNLTYNGLFAIRKTNNSYDHTVTERSNVSNAHRIDFNDKLREINPYLYADPNDPHAFKESILPEGGFLTSRNNWQSYWNIRNSIRYNNKIDNHKFALMLGTELEQNHIDRQYNKVTGYLYYGGKIASPTRLAMIRAVNLDDRTYIESFEKRRAFGTYTSLEYTLNDKYNFEATGRIDANNMFGKLTRTKFLPNYSIGASWNLDREAFFERINSAGKIDAIKLRVSHALRGNAFETSPMLQANVINLTRLDLINNAKGINISSPELFNLNWEKDYITNFGLELNFLKRLTFAGEYYRRRNVDLVREIAVANEEGFQNKLINFGNMTNNGVDITFGFTNILNKQHFHWDINVIYGYVKNTLIKGQMQSPLLTEVTKNDGYNMEGYPLETLFAMKFAGLNNSGQPTFTNGKSTLNFLNLANKDLELVKHMGPRQPTSTGSFTNAFRYKDFEFRVFMSYALGHSVFLHPIASLNYDDSGSKSGDLNFRWQTIGDEEHTNIPGLISTFQRNYLNSSGSADHVFYNRSDFRVAKASHFRLNEILISYNLLKLINKSNNLVKNARVMLSANNIHYWASGRLRGVDPELYLTGGTALPNPRSYTFRLVLGF